MGIIPDFAIGVVVIVATVSAAVAVLTRLGILGRTGPTTGQDVAELRQAVDALQNRLAELEDRLDFTERLLSTYREADRLRAPPE